MEPEPISCHACGLTIMTGRGGDSSGWKGVQMSPEVAELRWFCMKPLCQQGYRAALGEAQYTWAGVQPEPEPESVMFPRRVEPRPPVEVAEAPQEARGPGPSELVAYETEDVQEAGYLADDVPFSRFVHEEASGGGKFIRHRGTGERHAEDAGDGGGDAHGAGAASEEEADPGGSAL